jgi:hypothetical protein
MDASDGQSQRHAVAEIVQQLLDDIGSEGIAQPAVTSGAPAAPLTDCAARDVDIDFDELYASDPGLLGVEPGQPPAAVYTLALA